MARRLTVLHLIDTGGPGGAETIFSSLVTGLPSERWCSLPVIPTRGWLHERLTGAGVEPVVLPGAQGGGIGYLRGIHDLVRGRRVDVVQAHLLGSAVYGTLAAAPSRVPVVCTFHGLPDIADDGRFLRTKMRILSRRRNRLVFVSKALRDAVQSRHALPRSLVRVVYNGIDGGNVGATGTERRELGASDGDLLVGAVGNLRPTKDYANLLRAAARVRDLDVPLRLVVLGEGGGSLKRDLLELRRDLGLDDVVAFLGFRNDAERLLTGFDVFVSSSSSEGFSLAIVEALRQGKPVVATRSGGPEEIVTDGETGLLVPVGDPDALAAAILRLRDDPSGAQVMGRAGQVDVERRFSRERMVGDYETIYREVLDA